MRSRIIYLVENGQLKGFLWDGIRSYIDDERAWQCHAPTVIQEMVDGGRGTILSCPYGCDVNRPVNGKRLVENASICVCSGLEGWGMGRKFIQGLGLRLVQGGGRCLQNAGIPCIVRAVAFWILGNLPRFDPILA
ncbi:MAG: hypothetical protein RIG27_29095 [Coleofasciculus sp. F4-SAH-05]